MCNKTNDAELNDIAWAKMHMVTLLRDRLDLQNRLECTSREAFPVGSTHTCTKNGEYEVVIVRNCDAERVFVRNERGKEYYVGTYWLGVTPTSATRRGRG